MELPHPFLVQGIELLDTPGLNENARLEQIVEEEAGRSDAFVLVLSGMQPVTRLETEAILKISAREKPIFIVCNFMNAVPTAQRPLVEKRVKTTVAKLAPAANVQFWFVSAEPALLHLMCDKVDESDAIWTQEIVDLRRSLVKFLAEERGSVEIHNTQICLRTYLSKAQAAIEQRIETDRLAEDTQRDEKEDLLRRDAEWLRTEEKEIPQRRKRMRLQVQRFEEELCARTCDIADQVLNDLAKELPASAKRWKSESSALMPWAVARDYGKQVEHFFERQLNERIRRSLAPIIDELVHQLAKNLGQDAAVLYQTASGATVGQVSIAAAKEDPESAGIRLLKTVVGVALVGPAGLAAGAAPISHIIAMAVSAFAVAFLIAFLGGGPITAAIGIATSTVLIIFVGADGMKDAIRDKLILKIVQEIPGMREDVHESIKKEIEKKGKAILAELDREIKRLEQETRLRLNEIEEDIAQLKSSPRLYSSRFEQKLALTKQLIERLSEI